MSERTALTPAEEAQFQAWARANDVRDVDHPGSRYDYRGYWKQTASRGESRTKVYADGLHYTDQFKQHGHPTFSVESQYSAGAHDGGRWVGEDYVPPGADMLRRSNGASRLDTDALAKAIRLLAGAR